MPYAGSFISRDNALYALDDSDQPRSFDQFNFSELTDWSSTNSSVTIVLDNREYPLFYVFRIVPATTESVTFELDNVTIGGVNILNLNNMNLVGHALVKCSDSIFVNTTLSVRSTIDTSRSSSEFNITSTNPDIQTAVRSGSIIVNKNKSAVITGAYGNGSYVTYFSKNSYSPGDSVFIFDTGLSSFNYNSTPATVQYATPQIFTVSNNTVGYVRPTSSYSNLSGPTIHQISSPFPQYSGENLTASLSFSFSGHNGRDIFLTIPVIADMNRIFSSWATNMTLDTTPQVYREIDEVSSPTFPMARLIHSLTAGVEDVMDKYAYITRTDPTVQPGFVDEDDNVNKSYLIDPEIAFPKHYDWLTQFIGQTRCYSTISSNKSADYRADIKVRCATTANITIASALNAGDSIDGVVLAEGDRVLVKNQSTASQNGIYIAGGTPARWDGMPASSVSISAVTPVTPSLGYAQFTTSAAHGFSVGDAIVIAGVTPSGYNGEYVVDSIPSTTTFVVETTQVATATVSSATAKRAISTTETELDVSASGLVLITPSTPDLIFVREGTVNKMTMWSPQSQGWTGTAHESTSITNDRTIATRTNLITNPSFETNATGWATAQSSATRSTLYGFSGSASYRVVMSSTSDSNIGATTVTGLTIGSFTMSLYVYVPAGSPLAGRTVGLSREGGTATVSSPVSSAATLVAGSWVRCSVKYTVTGAGTAVMVARLSGDLTTASGQIVYLDAALAENTATVSDYFDGYNDENSSWAIVGNEFINFSVKQVAAKAATTSNITIATALNAGDSIDGVVLAAGDYVLVKNQTTASENGVYQVAVTPVRITNLPVGIPLSTGFRTYVWGSGTQNTETMFTLDDDGVVGTDSLEFTATVKPFAWDDSDDFKLWQLTNKYFGYKAGTIESIEETVKRYLIGTKYVNITLNPPFGFTVYTLRNETPGIYYTSSAITASEVITNAISIIKPMGFDVVHEALETSDSFIIGDAVKGIIGTGRLG